MPGAGVPGMDVPGTGVPGMGVAVGAGLPGSVTTIFGGVARADGGGGMGPSLSQPVSAAERVTTAVTSNAVLNRGVIAVASMPVR